jgi:hypothetical protein
MHRASNLNALCDGIRVFRIILAERRHRKRRTAAQDLAEVISFPHTADDQELYDRQAAPAVSDEAE